MAFANIIGLDHVVVVVRDLDAAAQQWTRLGFTVSPRGTHSAHMGTGNHTIMLADDYLELLGVLTPTERNAPTRALLAEREGIERAAFTTRNAAEGVAELQAHGIAATGPIDFSRPVDLPDGRKTEAVFQTYLWPVDQRPGGMRIFACQHFTRDAVWLPHLVTQANTAERIVRVELVSPDAQAAAQHMGRLTDRLPERLVDGAWRVESGGSRGVFEFMDRATFASRHPDVPLDGLPATGALGLVLEVHDLKAAARAVGSIGVASAGRVTVPPAHANGVVIVFEA
jgi:catechol 2,3-dioxygenase-like lactoylglutathione lyase family enzyme